MVDVASRTEADDDELIERMRALAFGAPGAFRRSHWQALPGPFPALTMPELERAEQQLGYRLPELLRRVYAEIGDGGFGPDRGLASLMPHRDPQGHGRDWPCVLTIRAKEQRADGWSVPRSWFYLTYGGCSVFWYLSLIAIDDPVLLYDEDHWWPEFEREHHDGVVYAVPLREWLWTWATGGNVWEPMLAQIHAHIAD